MVDQGEAPAGALNSLRATDTTVPEDRPLGEPKRRIEDTLSAFTVIKETFFCPGTTVPEKRSLPVLEFSGDFTQAELQRIADTILPMYLARMPPPAPPKPWWRRWAIRARRAWECLRADED